MAERFLHVSFRFEETVTKERREELNVLFNQGLDWCRYSSNCYIVFTTSSPDKWFRRLRGALRSGELLFIAEIDVESAQGLLPMWIWEWLNFDRSEQKTVGDSISSPPKQAPVPR
jgi:hypothetical protein